MNIFGTESYFLFKFNLSARQQIFSGSCFTFWNRPYAVVFAHEKGSARVCQENFYFVILAPKHKQTGADPTARRFCVFLHNSFYAGSARHALRVEHLIFFGFHEVKGVSQSQKAQHFMWHVVEIEHIRWI